MRASLSILTPRFSSNRMLKQYVQTLYEPATTDYRERVADQGKLAKELVSWSRYLSGNWHELHFGKPEARADAGEWIYRLPVYLGNVSPDSVKLELYCEAWGNFPASTTPMSVESAVPGSTNGYIYHGRVNGNRPAEHYTARIRAYHGKARIPAETQYIKWQR
jgi:starch phosphorylase